MHLNGHGLLFSVCPYRQAGRVTAVTLLDTATRMERWSAPRLTYIHIYVRACVRAYVTTVELICMVKQSRYRPGVAQRVPGS
jgi:predicted lysophospholipase L1 biosynthesis ABC-type transport system permease subunit